VPPTPDLRQANAKLLAQKFGPYVGLLSDPAVELRLESLVKHDRLWGFARRYTIIIPLLSEDGEEVFSLLDDLPHLTAFLNHRFGGSTSPSHQGGPPLLGNWEGAHGACEDQNTSIMVYSRPIAPADLVFRKLKTILRRIGVQEEILIEKSNVALIR